MFDDRNVGMVDSVVRLMKEKAGKTLFVAVGTGHLPGEKGVVKLLQAKGLEVRRVKAGEKVAPRKKPERKKEPAGAGK